MVTVYDAEPTELIERAAAELKNIDSIKPPEWARFAKTGTHKERSPARDDWWYVRAAAVLRTIYNMGPIGVSKLRTKYGGKKRRGHKMPRFYKGSGSIIRKILQQLESAGFVKHIEKGVHKGRAITPSGRSFLDRIAAGIAKPLPKKVLKTEQKVGRRKQRLKKEKKAKPAKKAKKAEK